MTTRPAFPRFALGFGLAFFALSTCVLFSGCLGFGYQVGAKSLFAQDVKTVYVPIFRAEGARRDLAERLTEAVCKRIESRSSYKVVDRPSADSTLAGELVNSTKIPLIINEFDDSRQLSGTLSIRVDWRDRRNRTIKELDPIAWNTGIGMVNATSYLVAEYGQSEATMEQQQIDIIADQIVGMMETPW